MDPEIRKLLEDCQMLIADMTKFAGKMALIDYELLNEVPIRIREALKVRKPKVIKVNDFRPPVDTFDTESGVSLEEIEKVFNSMREPVDNLAFTSGDLMAFNLILDKAKSEVDDQIARHLMDPWMKGWLGHGEGKSED